MKVIYKKIAAIVILTVMIIVVFQAGVVTGSQGTTSYGTPGSINDPLITKSYLEERLAAIGGQTGSDATSGNNVSSTGMTRLALSRGDIVRGNEGTTFVLVEGSASAYGDAIINITQGEVMQDGMTVSKYNTFLATAKGVGVLAESKLVIYVDGTYDVVLAPN